MTRCIQYLLLTVASTLSASAQVEVSLVPLPATSDTLRVAVELGRLSETLPEEVTSFQFVVALDGEGVHFGGLQSEWTLSGNPGWTARANPENGRTGGFSSSLDAIDSGGVLGILVFQRQPKSEGDCQDVTLMLRELKLNSGSPGHEPHEPSVHLPVCGPKY